MDVEAPGANDGDTTSAAVTVSEIVSSEDTAHDQAIGHEVSADKDDVIKENETIRATDQLLENTQDDVLTKSLETEDNDSVDANSQEDSEEALHVRSVEPTTETASLALDAVTVETSDTVLMESVDDKEDQDNDDMSDQDEHDIANENGKRSGEVKEEMVESIDVSDTTEPLGMTEEKVMIETQPTSLVEDRPVDELVSPLNAIDSAESSLTSNEMKTTWRDGRAEKEVLVENADDSVSLPLTHNEIAYGPSTPPALSSSVLHGDDEYDPANPSTMGTPVASDTPIDFASHRPAAEQACYTDNSLMTSTAPEESDAMEVVDTATSVDREEQSNVVPAKRKQQLEDEPNPCSDVPANGNKDLKRPCHVDDDKSPYNDDHKHGRHRRKSGDSTLSSSSKQKHHEEDHKGLSAAAWDRLMDFQTSGEFQVTQVSRAAFAAVGAMPEFAQIAIIERFVRTPMREIRDKNGQLMRIFREYQKEHPQIAALQPVDAFVSDYKSDPRLFRFGYAPPQPASGVSNVQVPYQRDQPPKNLPANSPRQARNIAIRSEPDHQRKDIDEFGRAIHVDKDPRLSSRSRQDLSLPSTQAVPSAARVGRAEDPRRRDQSQSQSNSGAGRDPRRRGSSTSQQPSPRAVLSGASRVSNSSDLYERLPLPVKTVVNSMRHEGRLQEPLNDNVVTRLLHLPERVALQAVENFSNVDLSQVDNLQGFLVGIINRVNEKAIASEKQHRPQAASPRGHPPSALPLGGHYGASSHGGSVLGGPPQGGRLNSNNVVDGGGYRGQPAPMATGSAPALYDRPYDALQDIRDPRRRQPVPQGQPQYGGAVHGPPPAGIGHGPIGMQSFTLLPMSVQNHVHSLVANRTLASLEELGGKCYEVLGQLSEPLANQVLSRFAGANLSNVRNKSGFLIGVVKRARQEYGFN